MMKREELDEQFFDGDAVIPSIASFSKGPAPPEDMGPSEHQDTRSLRTGNRERSAAGNRRDRPCSPVEGGRRSERR